MPHGTFAPETKSGANFFAYFESDKLTFVSCFSYRNWTKIKLTKCKLDFIGVFQMQVAQLHRIPQNISMLWLPSIGRS